MAKNHIVPLGKLVGNLQSLETMLRYCLCKIGSISGSSPAPQSTWPYVVGDERDEDEFTNYDTLGALIGKYNESVNLKDGKLVVDLAVVKTRDLLAHGRVTASSMDEESLVIVKFSKPKLGKVKVEAAALMTDAWFEENNRLVRKQMAKVEQALRVF